MLLFEFTDYELGHSYFINLCEFVVSNWQKLQRNISAFNDVVNQSLRVFNQVIIKTQKIQSFVFETAQELDKKWLLLVLIQRGSHRHS